MAHPITSHLHKTPKYRTLIEACVTQARNQILEEPSLHKRSMRPLKPNRTTTLLLRSSNTEAGMITSIIPLHAEL